MARGGGPNDLEEGLRALAGEAGVAGKRGYPIGRDGRRLRVAYVTDSDDEIQSLSLVCRDDDVAVPHASGSYRREPRLHAVRPLDLRLERARDGHVRAKREGLVGEWQSGDPAFDERVFVTSPTTDPEVLAAVLHVATRRTRTMRARASSRKSCGMGRVRASLMKRSSRGAGGDDGGAGSRPASV